MLTFCKQPLSAPALGLITGGRSRQSQCLSCPSDKTPDRGKADGVQGRAEGLPEGVLSANNRLFTSKAGPCLCRVHQGREMAWVG